MPDGIYIIAEGKVKISRVTPDGYESILCIRGPGDIFCPVPILDRAEQLGAAVAMTEVKLEYAHKDPFVELCREHAELMTIVQGDCLSQVRRLVRRMETFAFHSVKDRVVLTILEGLQAGAPSMNGSFELRIKHQELAGLVGASRETISRVLAQLQDEGVLTVHRERVVIEDLAALKRLMADAE